MKLNISPHIQLIQPKCSSSPQTPISLVDILLSWEEECLGKTYTFTRHPISRANEKGSQPWVTKCVPFVLPLGHTNLYNFFIDTSIDTKTKQYLRNSCIEEYFFDIVWQDNNWVEVSKEWYDFAYQQSLAYRTAAKADPRLIPNVIMVSHARRARAKLWIVFDVCSELWISFDIFSWPKKVSIDDIYTPEFQSDLVVYIDGYRVQIIFDDLISERRQPDPMKFNAAYRALDPKYISYNKQEILKEDKIKNWFSKQRWRSEILPLLQHRVSILQYFIQHIPQYINSQKISKWKSSSFDIERLRLAAIWHHEHMIALKASLLQPIFWWIYEDIFVYLNEKYRPDNSATMIHTSCKSGKTKKVINNLFSYNNDVPDFEK